MHRSTPTPHLQRAVFLNMLGRRGEALEAVREALRLDPDSRTGQRMLKELQRGG